MTSEQQSLHDEIYRAWQRFADLRKAVMTLQADIDDLSKHLDRLSEQARKLYFNSANSLNHEPPKCEP